MSIYYHKDAFRDATKCAARLTKLGDELHVVEKIELAWIVFNSLKDKHRLIYDAFLEGVDWGRKHPRQKEGSE